MEGWQKSNNIQSDVSCIHEGQRKYFIQTKNWIWKIHKKIFYRNVHVFLLALYFYLQYKIGWKYVDKVFLVSVFSTQPISKQIKFNRSCGLGSVRKRDAGVVNCIPKCGYCKQHWKRVFIIQYNFKTLELAVAANVK